MKMLTAIFSDTRLDRVLNGYVKLLRIALVLTIIAALIMWFIKKDFSYVMAYMFVLAATSFAGSFLFLIAWYVTRLTWLSLHENKFVLLIVSVCLLEVLCITFLTSELLAGSLLYKILLIILALLGIVLTWGCLWLISYFFISIFTWLDENVNDSFLSPDISFKEFENIILYGLVGLFALCSTMLIYDLIDKL